MEKWQQHEAENLNRLFEGVNRAKFARDYDVPGGQSMIYQHIRGMRPISLDAAKAYARGFSVPLSEISARLADEAGSAVMMDVARVAPMTADTPALQDRPGHVRVEVLDAHPSAGPGGEPVDYPAVLDYMEVPEAWATHKLGRDLSRYRLLPVSGDSMSPTINDGDLAFVDTSIQGFDCEGIYVLIWNDRLLIKRLRAVLATQRIEIRSDNSGAYGAETVSIEELAQLHICGLVRCWWSIKGA